MRLETIEEKRARIIREYERRALSQHYINRIRKIETDVSAIANRAHPFATSTSSVGF